jgi:MFS transporter, BCD family, chlorophyll transporter
MKPLNRIALKGWQTLGTRYLPFADAATAELPLGRLLRLSLFQVSVGMAMVLLTGTLNRVMIVELDVPAWLVGFMVALPIVFAPFRALIGFKSDTHKSVLGWRRVPYIWFGTMMQFGGFAILPFALLILSGDTHGSIVWGQMGAALAFLLIGAGLHTTQTAGLALANDLAPVEARPRVVALLYVMLLLGMVVSALTFGVLLKEFSKVHLIQVIQGAAVVTFFLNCTALWKQEARNPALTDPGKPAQHFDNAWRAYKATGNVTRLLVTVGLGAAAFSMQDILLEPYGGKVFNLSVSATTQLTAILACGSLAGFAFAARLLNKGNDPHRVAALGALAGLAAFVAVIFSVPLESVALFRTGAAFIGFGGGLFSVGTLTSAMALSEVDNSGMAIGAWGAVQATCAGLGIAFSGALCDYFNRLGQSGSLGSALNGPAVGYSVVYFIEIGLLFATLIALGPLARARRLGPAVPSTKFGLAEIPG